MKLNDIIEFLRNNTLKSVGIFINLLIVSIAINTILLRIDLGFFQSIFTLLSLAITSFLFAVIGLTILYSFAGQNVPPANKEHKPNKNELLSFFNYINTLDKPLEAFIENDYIEVRWKLKDESWYDFYMAQGIDLRYGLKFSIYDESHIYVMEDFIKIDPAFYQINTFNEGLRRGWPLTDHASQISNVDIIAATEEQLFNLRVETKSFKNPIINEVARIGWTMKPCFLSVKKGI